MQYCFPPIINSNSRKCYETHNGVSDRNYLKCSQNRTDFESFLYVPLLFQFQCSDQYLGAQVICKAIFQLGYRLRSYSALLRLVDSRGWGRGMQKDHGYGRQSHSLGLLLAFFYFNSNKLRQPEKDITTSFRKKIMAKC